MRVARTVDIAARAFNPVPVTVTVGTRVFWVNRDVEPHTVTFESPVSYDSGWLSPSAEANRQFNLAGTFSYFCRLHEGMRGTVRVLPRDFVPTL